MYIYLTFGPYLVVSSVPYNLLHVYSGWKMISCLILILGKECGRMRRVSDAEKNRMKLSTETLLGLRITGKYNKYIHNICMYMQYI